VIAVVGCARMHCSRWVAWQTSVGEFMEGAVNWLYERDLFKSASDATVDYARDELEKCV